MSIRLRSPKSGRYLRQELPRARRHSPSWSSCPSAESRSTRTTAQGGLYQLPFGEGRGLITYLLLEDQGRVDVLVVTWVDFDDRG